MLDVVWGLLTTFDFENVVEGETRFLAEELVVCSCAEPANRIVSQGQE